MLSIARETVPTNERDERGKHRVVDVVWYTASYTGVNAETSNDAREISGVDPLAVAAEMLEEAAEQLRGQVEGER